MKAIVLYFTFFSLSIHSFAQSYYGQTWKMGLFGTDYKFVGNQVLEDTIPTVSFINAGVGFMDGSSNICDSNGNVRYASNGFNIYSNDGTIIEGGDTLCPHLFYNQFSGLLGVPQTGLFLPTSNGKTYYINGASSDSFYNDVFIGPNSLAKGCFDILQYCLIDDNANNGKGKVVKRAVPLINGGGKEISKPELTACRHANGKDWWLLKMAGDSIKVYRFLFTQDSVYDKGSLALPFPFRGYFDLFGSMSFSEDGSLWATTNTSWGRELFIADFDRCHGLLSNFQSIIVPVVLLPQVTNGDSNNSSCAISPNKRFIYVNRYHHIVQYDRQDQTFATIAELDTTMNQFAGYLNMALAPNGKIYVGTFHGTSKQMSVINNPDGKGSACDFCPKCLRGISEYSGYLKSPPNMPNYELGATSAPCYPLAVHNETAAENTLEVYPNPSSSIIHIKSKNINATKQLYNMVGKLILSTKENDINVWHLPKGIYFLKCQEQTRRVVVE